MIKRKPELSNSTSNNRDIYQDISKKRAYINSKIEHLDNISDIFSLCAISAWLFDVDITPKNKKATNKLSVAFVLLAALSIITKWITQSKLSINYDNKNSTEPLQ